jgi:hypothetical protein
LAHQQEAPIGGVQGVVDSFGNEITPVMLTRWVERLWKVGGDLGTDLRGKIEIAWSEEGEQAFVVFAPMDHPESADAEWRPWSVFDVERIVAFVEKKVNHGR